MSRKPASLRAVLILAAAAILVLSCGRSMSAPPQVHDPRLELTLVASDPEIVTPIGLAIDSRDRLFVIESHTHLPPRDYKGPKSDHIKILEPRGAGEKPRVTTFAEGFKDAMNLAFGPDGKLYVACAREVWALSDEDDDGRADTRQRMLEMKTSNTYSHSALLGITFGPDGALYVSRGNNGSAAYTLVGSDGSSVSGYGDGGNIVRCLPDGSELGEFATGFWNPFDLKFDSFGRLLCVDNDPDARGPNRLLHIVQGGDYGYKSLYGGSGNHPFLGWEGELPGTLPMIDGTGEAPSGLLDCARAALPRDYAGNLMVTIWNENTITRHTTSPKGLSLAATNQILVSGDQDFRPVALDADSRGAVYITDWVLVDYPNHGRGRIWRLAAKPGQAVSTPRPAFASSERDARFETFKSLIQSTNASDFATLQTALLSPDPFVRHGAVSSLARPAFKERLMDAANDSRASVRLGSLLALRRIQTEVPEALLRAWLRDSSADIRRMALIWIGERGLVNLKDSLKDALLGNEVSATLFETYLAAMESLDPAYLEAFKKREQDKANQLRRKLPDRLLANIVTETNGSARVRSLALARLDAREAVGLVPTIVEFARHPDRGLQTEALRTLGGLDHPEVVPKLLGMAMNRMESIDGRAEALLALGSQPALKPEALLPLLNDPSPTLQNETIRLLRMHATVREVRAALERKHKERPASALREQLEMALGLDSANRPASLDAWQQALAVGGGIQAGERAFFSSYAGCSQCHTIGSSGGKLGPDLSNAGQSLDRAQIIHAILRPSDQFAPQHQAWFVRTKDGETHEGLQLDHAGNGALELLTASGAFQKFPAGEIDSYGVLPRSLMPDGLENGLTVSDLRDLAAFLASRR